MQAGIDERALAWALYFLLRALPAPPPARAAVEAELRLELGLDDPDPSPEPGLIKRRHLRRVK